MKEFIVIDRGKKCPTCHGKGIVGVADLRECIKCLGTGKRISFIKIIDIIKHILSQENEQ